MGKLVEAFMLRRALRSVLDLVHDRTETMLTEQKLLIVMAHVLTNFEVLALFSRNALSGI